MKFMCLWTSQICIRNRSPLRLSYNRIFNCLLGKRVEYDDPHHRHRWWPPSWKLWWLLVHLQGAGHIVAAPLQAAQLVQQCRPISQFVIVNKFQGSPLRLHSTKGTVASLLAFSCRASLIDTMTFSEHPAVEVPCTVQPLSPSL